MGGSSPPFPPQVVLRAPKKNFDWPKAQKKIWPTFFGGGGSRGGGPPRPSGVELLKGALAGGGGEGLRPQGCAPHGGTMLLAGHCTLAPPTSHLPLNHMPVCLSPAPLRTPIVVGDRASVRCLVAGRGRNAVCQLSLCVERFYPKCYDPLHSTPHRNNRTYPSAYG